MKKKIKIIVGVVILLLIIAIGSYYFWQNNFNAPQKDPIVDLFEFKVIKTDLEDWAKVKYQEEFTVIKESLTAEPDQLDGWLRLGQLKKYLGDYKGAELAWQKAGEYRPNNSLSFGNLADLYANFTKEYDKVPAMYQKAIENSLGGDINPMLYRNFYYFYKDYLKDNQKAEEILLEGLANNPQSDLAALLANFYKETGDKIKAIEYFQKALEINPDNEAVKEELNNLK